MVNIFVYRVQVGLQFEGGGHHAKYEYSTACSDIFTPREVEMGIKNNDSRPFYVHITVSQAFFFTGFFILPTNGFPRFLSIGKNS